MNYNKTEITSQINFQTSMDYDIITTNPLSIVIWKAAKFGKQVESR